MRPLRYSINVTLDGCCDHRAVIADEDLHRHAVENRDRASDWHTGKPTARVGQLLAVVLLSYSPLNLVLSRDHSVLFIIKSVVEESFLRCDPEYAAYLQKVRWRWIPGIA
jgi:hypothetical protein